MSPKQWLALSCVYISYLFFGASVFHYTEHTTELKNRAALLEERIVVTGKCLPRFVFCDFLLNFPEEAEL